MPIERTTITVHGDVWRMLKEKQRTDETLGETVRRAAESLDEQTEPNKEVTQ